jgi:hypothetical protein
MATVIGPELRNAASGERIIEQGIAGIVVPEQPGQEGRILDALMLLTDKALIWSEKFRAVVFRVPWELVVSAGMDFEGVIRIVAGPGDNLEQELFWFGPIRDASSLRDAVLAELKQRVEVDEPDPRTVVRASGVGCVQNALGTQLGIWVVGTEEAIVVRDRDEVAVISFSWEAASWFRSFHATLDVAPDVFTQRTSEWITASLDNDDWRLVLQPVNAEEWVTLFRDHGVRDAHPPSE